MMKLTKIFIFGLCVSSSVLANSVLTGQPFKSSQTGHVVYRANHVTNNMAQIYPTLPVTEQDKQIDEKAFGRTIRFTDLEVGEEFFNGTMYCVPTEDKAMSCQHEDGTRYKWHYHPKEGERSISEWVRYSFARQACFIRKKSKKCEVFL